MPLESGAQFISDLVPTNPPTSDLETQGANHLQLLKQVLQNVFGTTSRRYVGLQTGGFFNSSQNITANQANTVFQIDTTAGALNFTLPTLGVGDAGWECSFIKNSFDTNPFFILPPSGTLWSGEYANLAKARRCIPGRRTRVFWTSASFRAERVNSEPVGAVLDYATNTLPVGYEWANGQTLAGVSGSLYPEYFQTIGQLGTPDLRGRAVYGLDNMGGAAAGRISVAGGNFDGTVLWGNGGAQNHTLAAAELPLITPSGAIGGTQTVTLNNVDVDFTQQQLQLAAGFVANLVSGKSNLNVTINGSSFSFTGNQFGGGAAHTVLSPALTMAKILVVE